MDVSSPRDGFDHDAWRAIAACLANREMSLENVADTMGIHPRTLQRRLARVGLTYKQLVGEVRHDMARYPLALSDMPISQIASQLGYAEPAHFTPAFNRWTGMPPHTFRARLIERSAKAR